MERLEKMYDIISKMDFFNQRAARELWSQKPEKIQNQDIFNRHQDLCEIKEFVDDVAELMELEEQGLLLKLPVAEGTEVHKLMNNTDACVECNHYSDFYGMDSMCDKADILSCPRYADEPICEKQFWEVLSFKADLEFIIRNRNNFGKTVFLTKEEAEAKLKELENE